MRLTGLEPPYTLTPYYRCTLNWQIPRFAQGYKSESREKEIVQIRLNSVQDYQEVEGNDTEYLKEKGEKESNIVMQMEMWEKIISQLWKSGNIFMCSVFETLCLGLRADSVKGSENKCMYNILLVNKKAITRKWFVKDSYSRGLDQYGLGYFYNGEANIHSQA